MYVYIAIYVFVYIYMYIYRYRYRYVHATLLHAYLLRYTHIISLSHHRETDAYLVAFLYYIHTTK